MKAHDCYIAYACSDCHRWLDESAASRAEKVEAFNAAMHRTWLRTVAEWGAEMITPRDSVRGALISFSRREMEP